MPNLTIKKQSVRKDFRVKDQNVSNLLPNGSRRKKNKQTCTHMYKIRQEQMGQNVANRRSGRRSEHASKRGTDGWEHMCLNGQKGVRDVGKQS